MVSLSYVDCAIILIFLLNTVLGKQTSCDSTTVVNSRCTATETCVQTTDSKNGYCECLPGLTRVNATFCKNVTKSDDSPTPRSSSLVDEDEGSGSGHVVAGILIPIFLIAVVICGIYFSRKYNLVSYVRSKIYQRNSNYDEVMIGQDLEDDDPPLR